MRTQAAKLQSVRRLFYPTKGPPFITRKEAIQILINWSEYDYRVMQWARVSKALVRLEARHFASYAKAVLEYHSFRHYVVARYFRLTYVTTAGGFDVFYPNHEILFQKSSGVYPFGPKTI